MRLILRNCHHYYKINKVTAQWIIEPQESYQYGQFQENQMEMQRKTKKDSKQLSKQEGSHQQSSSYDFNFNMSTSEGLTDDINEFVRQSQWGTAAPHMMIQGYKYLEPINRSELAKQKLKDYEKSLNLSVQNTLEPRLHNQDYIKKRQAELFLHRMAPHSNIFLQQGVNFLSAHVFAKLIDQKRLSILKDFLNKGAFQSADFVDKQFLDHYLPHFIDDSRHQFLINVVCFETQLLGNTPVYQQGQQEQQSTTDETSSENLHLDQIFFIKCLDATINNRKELNRLRIFWSLKKLYLQEQNIFPLILEQLRHVFFKTSSAVQIQIQKQMNFISSSSYSPSLFNHFVLTLFNHYKTFHGFITAYSLSILALSKLRSINRMLPQNQSNQLHPIFQLIEFNLPKESNQKLILSIFQLLSHQEHSRIQFQNFKRSYNYWLKDYTQPEKTKYHSPLTRLLQNNEQSLVILYERDPSMPEYAKFSHKLTRNKESKPNHPYFHQRDMIKHLLKKDYQPVLNYFITTFGLSVSKDLSLQFQAQMNKIEKKLTFKNKNQEALYKLKSAHNLFFTQSLPQPLSFEKLNQPYKDTYDAQVVVSTLPIDRQDHLKQDQAIRTYVQTIEIVLSPSNYSQEINPFEQIEEQEEELAAQAPVLQEVQAELKQEGQVVQAEQAVEAVDQEVGEVIQQNQQLETAQEQKILQMKQAFMYQQLFNQMIPVFGSEEQQTQYREMVFERKSRLFQELSTDDRFLYKQYFQSSIPFIFNDDQHSNNFKDADGFLRQFDSQASEDSQEQEETKPFFNKSKKILRQQPKEDISKEQNLTNKNKFQFCSYNQPLFVQAENVKIIDSNKVEQLRHADVDKNFLLLLQTEQHISNISSGSNIAKYLFLHGKNQNSNFVLRPNKTLNIEFSSVVGTRAKNYQKYVKNSLFRYSLSQDLYEQLLASQIKKYNRFEFKSIVSHLICYNDQINDATIDLICKICDKERIGYTFVEIAQLIKFNDIRVSSQALQSITNLWQRFEVINEDMFSFVRQYCRKMQIPIKTEFYARYCKSLIKTKNFAKLELIVGTVLTEIRPKTFKIDSSMNNLKADQVAVIEKEWKAKEQQNYLRLYLQIIEVIVKNLDNTVPAYLSEIFDEYRKMKPSFNEKEFAYAFVCYSNKRQRVEELLNRLDKQPEKGTSFMYDCLLQTILSNFQALQQLSQKMLDVSILKNRVVLSNEQIIKSLIVFKKSSSSNSFSKFLDHCLRFQQGINKSNEIKRQMFYILNNNVEDVSAGGIFNLLDFIFNDKREKQRIDYRAIKLSQEEKSRKLQEIQQATTKVVPKKQNQKVDPKKDKKKTKKAEESQAEKVLEVQDEKAKQQKVESQQQKKSAPTKKEDKKKIKKQKSQERQKQNDIFDQLLAQKQAKNIPQASGSNSDEEFVQLIKGQTKKHESSRRKSLLSMGTIFEGSMELSRQEEAARARQLQKKNQKKEPQQKKKSDKKGKGDKKK